MNCLVCRKEQITELESYKFHRKYNDFEFLANRASAIFLKK